MIVSISFLTFKLERDSPETDVFLIIFFSFRLLTFSFDKTSLVSSFLSCFLREIELPGLGIS
jgi:hypothetical protein